MDEGLVRRCLAVFLLLICSCCVGLQYDSLENYSNDDGCALILNSPGRTSAYDYTYNLLRGSQTPTGSQMCITYEAINRAYYKARKRINVAQPHTEIWKPEELATVGELLLDISTTLAQM
uniref:Ppp1r3c protein n=1 Tax=Fopius arisanus TaxID=64838 RepID=A0A0C9RXX3_9HYME